MAFDGQGVARPDHRVFHVNHTFVEVHDTKAVDFPNIREALKSEGFSYDFYQRRAQDGDHTMWHHSRNGRAEIYSNFGRSEELYDALFDCKL